MNGIWIYREEKKRKKIRTHSDMNSVL